MAEVTSSHDADVRNEDQSPLISLVRSAWQQTLGYDTPDIDASFFDEGGDSFVLIVLIGKIEKASGITIRAVDVLRAPTIRKQAALLSRLTDKDRVAD
ncbi:acyl carrier protein [Catellatospora sp. TT07R-123]|uniref:acyl carrier protein n=1 Tax=Catellatospora sp. TT07R-123 TaxID=2733863 RepID=UPI001BB3372D|nr:acyl carrier protein [Catellatospora sp. TT07R-123]